MLIVAAFGLLGIIGLRASRADSFTVSSEAESGIVTGNAAKITDSHTSGSQAVKFGAAQMPRSIAAPYRFQAITGGNSIAVVWTASIGSSKIKNYEVYRNDAKIATVTPGTGVINAEIYGRTYIDKAVTAGTSYRYKVRAVAYDGSTSPFTATSTVTHPRDTTPLPTITFDTSKGGSDLLGYLQTTIKPHLETWYPKVSDAIAYPNYAPRSAITINMSLTSGVANASFATGLIQVNPTWLQANLADGGGMFIHEATHVIQAYGNGDPSQWSTEGIADWTRDWFTMERSHIPAPNAQLSQKYSESGHMLEWAQTKYSPGLVRKLNIELHKGSYTSSFFTNLTGGKSGEQLYDEVKQQYYGSSGEAKGIGNKCMDVVNNSIELGAKLQLFVCNNEPAQKWTAFYRNAGLYGTARSVFDVVNYAVTPSGRCLDVVSSGTASGTKVHSWICNRGDAQAWTRGANSSLLNPNSGKCLSTTPTTGGGAEDGNRLIIADCNGSANQRWTLPQ